MIDRRSFLLWSASTAAAGLGSAAAFWRWQEIDTRLNFPGRSEGHFLRDHHPLPPPSSTIQTDVVILGSGIAGLTAAWKMHREGHSNFTMIRGPENHGNAAGGRFGDLAFPTGAHYLPVPSTESFHVREILSDLGILLRNPEAERPYYDERFLLHAPEERLLRNGRWQEGIVPTEGVPENELIEQRRFFTEVERLRTLRDLNGKRIFAIPSVLSSTEPEWLALDRITFRQWLQQNHYQAPSLLWYLNYCCRDDFGARVDQVSAWAGLHYFCSRVGKAENAENGAWLTWPGGLSPLAEAMDRAAGAPGINGTAYKLTRTDQGVEVLCFELVNGLPRTYLVKARKAICAMPLFVASRVVESIHDYGFDPALHMPAYAPWLVANFLMNDFPDELADAPLSWDNVVQDEPGLGYVVSTHQDIRVAPPPKTVFTSYVALSNHTPDQARRWMDQASAAQLLELVSADLKKAYGWKFAACANRVEITLRGHAMAIPAAQFRSNAGLKALRELDGPVLFAHSDLSGFSVFEEAAWWGYRAARLAMK